MNNNLRSLYKLALKSIKLGFIHIFTGSVLVKCISFFTSALISHTLLKPEMALIGYGDNIYSYFNLFLGMGVSGAIVRFCSSSSDKKKVAYLKYGFKIGLVFQVITMLVIILIAQLSSFPFPNTKEIILIMLFFPMFQFIYDYSLNYIRAEMRHIAYAYLSVIFTISLLGLIFILVNSYHIMGILTARYISYIISILACAFVVIKILKEYKNKNVQKHVLSIGEKKEFVKFSIINQLAAACSALIAINEVFLVNNLIKDSIISADFKIAAIIPQNILFLTGSVMIFVYPYFVKHSKEKKWIWNKTCQLVFCLAIFYFICLFVYYLLGQNIISVLFGEQYATVATLSILLFFANSIEATFRVPLINIFSAVGQVKFNLVATICSTIVHFAIDYLLITNLGISGAIYGVLFTYCLFSGIYWYALYRFTHS